MTSRNKYYPVYRPIRGAVYHNSREKHLLQGEEADTDAGGITDLVKRIVLRTVL
jgi:hypothetical protein